MTLCSYEKILNYLKIGLMNGVCNLCQKVLYNFQRKGRHALSPIITRGNVDSTSNQLIDSLGWTSLQERRKTARLRMLYKAINREVALSIDMLCRPDSRTRGSTQNFRIIKTKKIPFSKSFYIRTIPDSNKLPSDVKLAPTFTVFKATLKKSG